MKLVVLFIACICSAACGKSFGPAPGSGGQTYAVLVAGSKTYMNYRHQVSLLQPKYQSNPLHQSSCLPEELRCGGRDQGRI